MKKYLLALVVATTGCKESDPVVVPVPPTHAPIVVERVVYVNVPTPVTMVTAPADAQPSYAAPPVAAVVPCTNRYYLVVETRMHSFSLSITRYIRNRMNATTVKLPVDGTAYRNAYVGQELDSSFDGLGLALGGHVQEVRATVKSKYTDCTR